MAASGLGNVAGGQGEKATCRSPSYMKAARLPKTIRSTIMLGRGTSRTGCSGLWFCCASQTREQSRGRGRWEIGFSWLGIMGDLATLEVGLVLATRSSMDYLQFASS